MHNGAMRSHSEIVRKVGEADLVTLTGASVHTIRSWVQRDSIPPRFWELLVSKKHCTADELMAYAAAKKAA
jgi:hypothetical protein